MSTRICVTLLLLATFYLQGATQSKSEDIIQVRAKTLQAILCYDPLKNKRLDRYTPCGDGLYCDGGGTCCSPIQTNPASCQPPPRR